MADEKRRPRPAAQYGPTAALVARNVERLRKTRNLTIYSLSAELGKAGRPITPSAIAKIEKMQRQVNVDDLLALAVVFGVSPAALLLPLEDSPRHTAEITGAGAVPADSAWAWASNKRPLKFPPGEQRTAEMEYALASLPPNAREARQHPAGRAIEAAYEDVTRVIVRAAWSVEGDEHEFIDALDQARASLERTLAELGRLAVEHEELVRLRDGVPREGSD
ncbi:helix-turn-helix domain-containing protein [Streptomyces kebangsaanensis]|uniref:Helix-turn-helix domain-containing protein n=1 Tax=Streptomyces kebangsaanensis TaxID=864058 RepID=A0ABW6KWU4_9ACTN